MADAPNRPASLSTVLETERLSIRFGSTRIFDELSFRIARGEMVVVIGPNGAGKTVLLRALIGATPYEGTIRWAAGVRIGYVPQKLDVSRDVPITGLDFLKAKIRLHHASPATLLNALSAVGLSIPAARQSIGSLSGGQFQRLLLAFALVGDPDILLLDEPTAGIDDPGQEQLYELLARLRQDRGLTIILVSHDLSIVPHHATHVLCLSRRLVAFEAPQVALTPRRLQALYGAPIVFHAHDH